jgi:putative methyltransferase (TIGR04325 family)
MPVSRTNSYLKQIIPPFLLDLLKVRSKYGWKGDFENWQEAKNHSGKYDDSHILEKVKNAISKVKNGEAVYERDSVLFEKIQYSWPLLSSLFWIALQKKSSLKVADFGGSLGSSYFQNKQFLSELSYLEWNIIEQENFVQCGREFFQDNNMRFFYSIDELIRDRGVPDILILSCVLPYLEKPHEVLETLMDYQIPYLLIDNTFFNYEPRDRICVQEVPPEIYTASYPCWMLSYPALKTELTRTYQLISEHENDSFISLDGKEIRYRGMLLKRDK